MNSSVCGKEKYTVIVTGVGAIIGQGIVSSLRQCPYDVRIIGIDRSKNSLGPYICDSFYTKPVCNETEEEYLAFWEALIAEENADLILPGIEIDVCFLNQHKHLFDDRGVQLGLNDSSLIELSSDKWLFNQKLSDVGFLHIPSVIDANWSKCINTLGSPPFILKPRSGNGSRGLVWLYEENDLLYWHSKLGNSCLIQKLVGSEEEEYTVGAFGFGDGVSLLPIIFRRKLSATGSTQYAEVIDDSSITEAIVELSKIFHPIGPTNYQFRKEDRNLYLLEINPRLSSSTSIRANFGYNEARMSLEYYVKGMRPPCPKITAGRAWRFAEDFVKNDSDNL